MTDLFPLSERARALDVALAEFMTAHILPAEREFADWDRDPQKRWTIPPLLESLKAQATSAGLWNLFLPDAKRGAGLRCCRTLPWIKKSRRDFCAIRCATKKALSIPNSFASKV